MQQLYFLLNCLHYFSFPAYFSWHTQFYKYFFVNFWLVSFHKRGILFHLFYVKIVFFFILVHRIWNNFIVTIVSFPVHVPTICVFTWFWASAKPDFIWIHCLLMEQHKTDPLKCFCTVITLCGLVHLNSTCFCTNKECLFQHSSSGNLHLPILWNEQSSWS